MYDNKIYILYLTRNINPFRWSSVARLEKCTSVVREADAWPQLEGGALEPLRTIRCYCDVGAGALY